jgi:hypothetical protein
MFKKFSIQKYEHVTAFQKIEKKSLHLRKGKLAALTIAGGGTGVLLLYGDSQCSKSERGSVLNLRGPNRRKIYHA